MKHLGGTDFCRKPQIFAGKRRKPRQRTAGTRRKPQIGVCPHRFFPSGAAVMWSACSVQGSSPISWGVAQTMPTRPPDSKMWDLAAMANPDCHGGREATKIRGSLYESSDPEGPTIKKIQSRSKFSISIEIFNLARKFLSRRLDFPTKNRASVGGSLEIFNLARNLEFFWSLGPLGRASSIPKRGLDLWGGLVTAGVCEIQLLTVTLHHCFQINWAWDYSTAILYNCFRVKDLM